MPDGTLQPDYSAYVGNTSATGGFLLPLVPPPDDDLTLDVDVQKTVAGITGFALNNVVPRWQQKPPAQPEIDVNWVAVGVSSTVTNYRPAVVHRGEDGGSDVLMAQEQLTCLLSFYGPAASGYAKVLRDGIQIAQNREAMSLLGLSLVEIGRATTLPAVVGQLWQRRVDFELVLRRQVTWVYAVQNLDSASGTIVQDGEAETAAANDQITTWQTPLASTED